MSITILPDWKAPRKPLRHTWEGLVNIDQFQWMVRKDTFDQLATARGEIGARHVRAVGMYDDVLKVIGPDPSKAMTKGNNEPRVNWQVVDYVIQNLLDIGISPMFTTTFVPSEMASGDRTCFTTKSSVSLPKSFSQWESFVKDSVTHMSRRFGSEVIRSWYYEVWNEPNLSSFFDGTQKQFFTLWECTYNAIKSVDPALKVGGPSTARAEWIEDLISYGRNKGCEPDYIITHCYNNDSASKPLSPFEGPQEEKANKSPHFIRGVVRGVRQLLDKLEYRGEVHWNEWGRSWHPYDPIRESEAEAAFIVKTMAEVSQDGDYFAYWNLSDIYDQCGYGAETFHGNYGMLNLQGLRKPSYHAHQLLCEMGCKAVPVKLAEGDDLSGAIITDDGKSLKLLVYNYLHDDMPSRDPVQVQVKLPDNFQDTYDVQQVSSIHLSSRENNILRFWEEMDSPAYLTREQLASLKKENTLKETAAVPKITGEQLIFSMDTPSVAFIKIKKKY